MNETIIDSGTGESDTCIDEGDSYKLFLNKTANDEVSIIKIFDLLEIVDEHDEKQLLEV